MPNLSSLALKLAEIRALSSHFRQHAVPAYLSLSRTVSLWVIPVFERDPAKFSTTSYGEVSVGASQFNPNAAQRKANGL